MSNIIPALPPANEDSRLAAELAQEISSREDILERYGLTAADLLEKLKQPHFRAMYREARAAWKSDLNVTGRVRRLAAHLVEDSLLPVYGIVHNPDLHASVRLDAFGQLSKIANVDKPPAAGAEAGAGVTITFNIGQDQSKSITIEAPVLAVDSDDG